MRQSCHRLLEHQQTGGEEPPLYSPIDQVSVLPGHASGSQLTQHVPPPVVEDEATLRQLLMRLQKQVSVMSMSLSAKLDDMQRAERPSETTVALSEIRTQLQELTRSVESCQSEVSEVCMDAYRCVLRKITNEVAKVEQMHDEILARDADNESDDEVKRDMVAIKHELDTVQQVKEEIEELREYVDRLEEHSQRRKLRLLEQGLTFFLTYAIVAAVLGMLQFGYNTGVINAPGRNIENFMKDVYKDRYGKDIHEDTVNRLYSIAVSIFAIGGMVGGFSGGMIANRFGRKGGLLLNNILGITGASLMGFTKISHCYELLFFGRFIIGVNCGLNTSLVPMYISEIAPLNLRGGLGTVNQLAVTVGLLLSQVLGIEQILGTDEGWPILLGLAICPAILQLLLLPACPESPRYLLITRQWEEEARRALRRLRASNQVEEDIEEMRAEERAQQAEASISMRELLCSPTLRAPLLIGVVMQLSQQLSGINAVFYYSTSLFTSSGLTEESAKFATMGIGAIMVAMTLVSLPLMDRTGRRTLHLYGLGGMFIFSIFITISFLIKEMIDWMSYLSVVSTLSFVVFFAVGPGSIPWLITAELFSQGPRPSAMAIAVLVNWMANFIVGIGFPTMKALLENYTFLPFSVFLAIFWIFTYKKVPETKNKTFEEILALFRNSNGRDSFRDSRLYGSMLNCVNALEQQLPPPPPPATTDEKHDSLFFRRLISSPTAHSQGITRAVSDEGPPSQAYLRPGCSRNSLPQTRRVINIHNKYDGVEWLTDDRNSPGDGAPNGDSPRSTFARNSQLNTGRRNIVPKLEYGGVEWLQRSDIGEPTEGDGAYVSAEEQPGTSRNSDIRRSSRRRPLVLIPSQFAYNGVEWNPRYESSSHSQANMDTIDDISRKDEMNRPLYKTIIAGAANNNTTLQVSEQSSGAGEPVRAPPPLPPPRFPATGNV